VTLGASQLILVGGATVLCLLVCCWVWLPVDDCEIRGEQVTGRIEIAGMR
jgi:hypothetical protein